MAKLVEVTPNKTYATKDNVIKAVNKYARFDNLRYIITTNDDGRFYPVFIGESAVNAQAFFVFPVVN